MAEMDDEELFSSANADDSTPEVTEQPATPEAPLAQDDRPRDEHGRFAPKQAETTVDTPPHQAVPQAPQEADGDVRIPPWRLREMREERDAINQRYLDTQRQLEMLQRQMPKPEPKPAPDLFENPNGAIEYGVQQYVDPQIQQMREELAQLKAAAVSEREETSRELAIEKYGEDVVRSAYTWIAQGMQSRNPDVVHAYNQAMQARRPFDVIVQAHKETSLMQQIKAAGGVEQWREQQLSQPQQQRQPSSQQPQGSNIKLPPTLRSVPSARSSGGDDDNDMSDAALFRHASR
jgi:hypothetical protein